LGQDFRIIQLVREAKQGDERAFSRLLEHMEPELKKVAAHYFIQGQDKEDVLQELRIGVYKAVQSYDETQSTTFRSFCINLVCKRHISTAIHSALRYKNAILNEAISLDAPMVLGDDGNMQTLAEFIPDRSNPLEEDYGDRTILDDLIAREELDENTRRLRPRLTPLEEQIFEEYGYDSSYKDIATNLDIQAKCVDNALMRIRKKASEVYQQYSTQDQGEEGEAPPPAEPPKKRRRR
jgi:RNA polymerase sporulation-specific sigma factor